MSALASTLPIPMPTSADPAPHRDPLDLRLHPLAAIPRWGKDTAEWDAFIRDIASHGVQHPVIILHDGTVVDGWTRVLAARALQLPTVPVSVIHPETAIETILRELLLRRNLAKSQLAYAAYPLIAPAHQEAVARKLSTFEQNFRNPLQTSEVHSVHCRDEKGGVEAISARFGISRRLFFQAADIHKTFSEHPELREQFEPSIYDPEHPAGLGAVLAGIGSLLAQRRRESAGVVHPGGRPGERARQLELFTQTIQDVISRWEYWQKFDEDTRSAHWRAVRAKAAELPADQCLDLAEYHARLAGEFRKSAKAATSS